MDIKQAYKLGRKENSSTRLLDRDLARIARNANQQFLRAYYLGRARSQHGGEVPGEERRLV